MCITDRHDMTLAVKVALKHNTTNQRMFDQVKMGFICLTLKKMENGFKSHVKFTGKATIAIYMYIYCFLFILASLHPIISLRTLCKENVETVPTTINRYQIFFGTK